MIGWKSLPTPYPTAVRATGSGPIGVVVFTEVSSDGGCGRCETTGSLNNYYGNASFNTLFVALITQCQTSGARQSSELSAQKLPVSEGHAKWNQRVPTSSATYNGHEHDLTGPGRLQAIDEQLKLGEREFHHKQAHMYSGLATDSPPTT
ncbi:hypothetical protein GGR57DRAFT_512098 [Xylariaceae sp. FL1272]|nr:hypothetical protein GGR57DRAFT_512098 [Xylariaceae sp. FL1272]